MEYSFTRFDMYAVILAHNDSNDACL